MAKAFPVAQRDGILTESINGELVVVDRRTQQAHALPALAATVWSLCDGNHSVAAIAARTGFSIDQVTDVLAQLRERDLLETAGTDNAIDRRAMLTRTAKLGGAAALAAPILTVALPAAAEASSTSATYYVTLTTNDESVVYGVTSPADSSTVSSVYDGGAQYPVYAPATSADTPLSYTNQPSGVAYVTIAANSGGSLTLTLKQNHSTDSATYTLGGDNMSVLTTGLTVQQQSTPEVNGMPQSGTLVVTGR